MTGRRPYADAIVAGGLVGLLAEVMVLRLNPEVTQTPTSVLLGVPLWLSWGAVAAGLPLALLAAVLLRLRPRRRRGRDHWWLPQLAAASFLLAAVLGRVNANLHPEFLSASGHRILWQDAVAWVAGSVLVLALGAGVRRLGAPRWARAALAVAVLAAPVLRVLWQPTPPLQSLQVRAEPLGQPSRPLLVVGLEGFDTRVLLGHAAGDRYENLSSLRDQGAWGRFRPDRPFLRDSLWTSVATGTEPGRHGVKGRRAWRLAPLFAEPLRLLPWTPQGSRLILPWWMAQRVPLPPATLPPLWQRIAASGVPTAVLGWPGSWPEPPIVTEPVEEPLEIQPDLARSIQTALGHFDDHRTAIETAIDADRRAVELARHHLASGATQVWIHLGSLAEARRWLEPRRPSDAREREVVDLLVELVDSWLGTLRQAASPDTLIVIASPYGLAPPGPWEQITRLLGLGDEWRASAEDCPDGLLLLAGEGVRPGTQFGVASMQDLAPTACYLLDLPVAQYMQGRVLLEAIDPAYLDTHPLRVVD